MFVLDQSHKFEGREDVVTGGIETFIVRNNQETNRKENFIYTCLHKQINTSGKLLE